MRIAISCVLAAATAYAHGVPPMTTDVHVDSNAPKTILAASSIGLLVSHDGGCTMEWICERNVGYGPTSQPKFAIAADGAILATTFFGLRISRDAGCNFETAAAPEMFIDALDVGPTGEIWIGTAETGAANDIFVSLDNGKTFAPRGLASTTLAYKSIEIAPSDPTRVYVSGDSATDSTLYRSDGAGWLALPALGLVAGSRVEIAAVDPGDRDTLYVISHAVTAARDDRLYRSTDGGMTFAEVLAPAATLHDVAIRDATVYATTMVKHEVGNFDIGGQAYVSHDGGKQFAPLAGAPQLACLTIAPDGSPVGCGWNWEPDFKALATFDGTDWQKLWRFVEIAGPVQCPADSGNRMCDPEWAQLEIDLAPTGPTCGSLAADAGIQVPPPPSPAGCCSANGGPGSCVLAFLIACIVGRHGKRKFRGPRVRVR